MKTKSELHAEAIATLKRRTQIQIKMRTLAIELAGADAFLAAVDEQIENAPALLQPTAEK